MISVWIYALPQGINEHIRKSGIPKRDISIYIKEVGTGGKVVASLNAEKSRTPASVIKVLSTYAAVLKLGFNYRWPTKFYTTGTLKKDVLHGDLYVKGFGDPTLSDNDLGKIVSYIRAEGIKKITGNIIIDRTYFQVGNKNTSGFDNHTYSAYNAMPDAMMFNERVSTVCVTPKKRDVHKESVDHSYKVVNNLKYVNKSCRGKYSWPRVKIDQSQAIPTVILKGKISKRCGKRDICYVLTKPYKSFYYALKEKLRDEGVKVGGTLSLKKVPKNATELFTYYSQSLEKIISKTAKKSNNLYARHLLLLLGAKRYGAPATVQNGRKAVERILRAKHALGRGTLKIDNGSGLSRTAKMTAKMLATMYDSAYTRYGQRWMNTLSVAGVDGTIKKRFRGTSVRNRAWMKTGTLRRTKNIGGYVKNKAGKLYTVVILVTTTKGKWKAAKLQNDIMQWLVNTSAKPSKKSTYKAKKKVTPKVSSKIKPKPKVKTKSKKRVYSEPTSYTQERFYVQAGSFATQPKKAYLLGIERLGLRYKVKYAQKYKVLIGPYSKENDARKVLKKVRANVSKGAFLTQM